jgi:hypothetical protein
MSPHFRRDGRVLTSEPLAVTNPRAAGIDVHARLH